MSVSRRRFLKRAGTGLVTTAGVLALPRSAHAATGGRRISGSGSYDLGPFDHRDDPDNPDNKVPLTTDLGFDETMVYCKVTTNFEPFIFPAFNPAFGRVPDWMRTRSLWTCKARGSIGWTLWMVRMVNPGQSMKA